jgi:redox-sensitive bicupin YhaK (pirin superfamily)
VLSDASAVELVVAPRRRSVGAGEVQRLLPFRLRRMVGPFVFADLMGPDRLDPGQRVSIDAHPHIGLATVTHLFEGRLVHRDSTGAVQSIMPGDVNWMTAGRGVSHTERSHPDDEQMERTVHGLQTWVALPVGPEDGPPSFQHAPAADIPSTTLPASGSGSATIRVMVGTGFGLSSPVEGASPLVLADIDLGDGADVVIMPDHTERAVIAVDAAVTIDGVLLEPQHLAVLRPGVSPELSGTGRVILLGGEPVGPRTIRWNFVHSDPARIDEAATAWAAQEFPKVPGDHEPWIPMPG